VIDRKGRAWAEGLGALFERDHAGLVRALTVVYGDPDEAAEAVMEAFVRAWERWGRIRRYDDPAGWIRRVALNQAASEQRNRARRRVALARWAGEAVIRVDPVSDGRLVEAVRRLPLRQRQAVGLYYLADLSIRDTAAAMGLSEGAVKAHLHHARRHLADQIGARP
jgi:RNA polymerase sigma-70 factor (ECF subfamily)